MSKLQLNFLFAALCALCSFHLAAQDCSTSDLAAQATGLSPSTCGTCNGTASVTATGGVAPYTYLWSTGDTTPAIGVNQSGASLCINTGGGAVNASNGNIFSADQYSSGGTTFSNAIPISNTTDDAIFQDERFVGNGGFFSYNVPVLNGNYLVELYFAEIFFGTSPSRPGGVGSRVFDVTIENALVLDDYDIFADAGGAAIAVIKSFNVNVTDGELNILFDGVVNNAKINALCVTPVSSAALCSGTYEVTVTDADGCTATTAITLVPGSCDDGDNCTTDTCSNDQCVYTALVCDDGDACTADSCLNGLCTFTAIPGCGDPCANIICDDGDACTADTCDNGQCTYTALNCEDNDACTADACDNGLCVNTLIPGCNDPCDTIICDDGDACTTDACLGGQCTYTALVCDDNDPCTADACTNGQCANTPVTCDDGDACTTDACVNGQCVFTALNCDDNDLCTTDACTNGQCANTLITCDDGDACTTDACNSGQCSNTPLDCADADACTADACDNGNCVHTPIPGCNDPCLTLNCDDNDACTTDGCVNGICTYTGACDDNDLCTMETCHPENDDDDDNYYSYHHHDDDDDGYHCHRRDKICDDNDKCTTDECVNGVCVFTPKVCDDGDACTTDQCKRGHCKFTEIRCNDNDACTRDSCGGGVCIYIPRNCADNDPCTVDACVPHNHNWPFWDDRFNNYQHTTCVHTPTTCDDNNACTSDQCNAGNCTNNPIAGCCIADAECADTDPCTADKCLQTVCRNTITTLKIDELQNGCQNGTATLSPSETGDSYAWSTGETTATIEGQPGASYSVTVTFASGCVKTATITVSPRTELLSAYVLIAEEEIRMDKNTVFDGGIGVTDNYGKVRLKDQTKITAAGTFVQADYIQTSGGSQVANSNPNPADVNLPAFEFNPYCSPWYGNNVNVPSYQNVTLNGSVYGNVTVQKNATVTFTSTDLNLRTLYLKDNATVHFANCTRVKICKWLHIGEDNAFNPGGAEVVLFVEDEAEVESGSTVFADIYVRNGLLEIKASASNDPTRLTGLFIAEWVDAGENAIWRADTSCDNSCAPAFQPFAAKTAEESGSTAEPAAELITEATVGNVHLKSYPNPFTDLLNIEFSVSADSRVRLEVYNLTGQLVATLFDGEVMAGALQRFEFAPQTNTEGIYIYRLQTATDTYVGKAIMVR